jgi:hypothetical protein
MSEPKVTECYLDAEGDIGGAPSLQGKQYGDRPAILLWREDYEQLKASLKHREELYWKLTAEFDAMRGELEELRAESDERNT